MVSSEGGRGKNFQNCVSLDMWMPPLQKFTTVIAELRRECFELPEGAMDSAIESIILKTAEDLMMWLCSLIEQWFEVPRQFCWPYCFGCQYSGISAGHFPLVPRKTPPGGRPRRSSERPKGRKLMGTHSLPPGHAFAATPGRSSQRSNCCLRAPLMGPLWYGARRRYSLRLQYIFSFFKNTSPQD